MLTNDWRWWSIRSAIPPIIAAAISLTYGLYILAYPPTYKKLSMFLLAIPLAYAFKQHLYAAPDFMLTDTFGRFLYIWYAHMSYEVLILEFAPAVEKENDNWKSRMKLAWRVIFDRNHKPAVEKEQGKRRDWVREEQGKAAGTTMINPQHAFPNLPQPTLTHTATGTQYHHGYGYVRFTSHHLVQSILLGSLLTLNDRFRASSYRPPSYDFESGYGSFFRRLPASLDANEMYARASYCFDWTIISLFEYEFYYSLFALLFVSLLRTDAPTHWPLSLGIIIYILVLRRIRRWLRARGWAAREGRCLRGC